MHSNRSIRWLLLAIALLSGLAYSQSNSHTDATKPLSPTKVEQRGSDLFPIAAKLIAAPDAKKKVVEDERNRAEGTSEEARLTNVTIALVVVTAILAIFTGGLWFATYRLARDARETSCQQAKDMQQSLNFAEKAIAATQESNRVTREAFVASERPWVSVEASINGDLFRRSHGIEFGVLFTVRNMGRSPAVNVHIFYEVITLKIAQDSFNDARQRIEKLGTSTNHGEHMGVQLFPSETKPIPWINSLTNAEIEAALASHVPPSGLLPSFYIIGSVFYQSSFGGDQYQTGFNYYVCDRGNPLYPRGSDIPDFVDSFPAISVVLDPVPYHKGAIT